MTQHGSSTRVPGEWVVGLGEVLMALVAGKDIRVRQAITGVVTRTDPDRNSASKARWLARHCRAANPPVE